MSFLRTKILKMKSNKVTLKVIVSYVLLICVSIVAGYVVYKEIQKLSHQEEINQQDRNKIIQISKILTLMNDTESAGRVAIRTDDREALQVFLEKNVTLQNEVLKFRRDITSERQLLTLDTITSLLNLKSENLQELKAFQESDSTSIIIRSAISKLSSLEPYLGYEVYNKTYSRRKNREYTPVPATDIASILKGLADAKSLTGKGKPVCILLHSEMGNGVDFMMGTHAWHGKAPNDEQLAKGLAQNPETLGDY